ncbi:MAG TPA: glycine zipper domain-containing protein [Thermodesulfovibrionales bacterium]|nr:glycine zipper domain-containing protein [Thermodesulfovibrionales bacterium]
MGKSKKLVSLVCILVVMCAVSLGGGCATQGQTGALTGAGAGALIGGLANMHGSWGATALLGAGIGAGVGYLIGNEEDKKDAAKRQGARKDELRPLAGTTWQVIKITPKPEKSFKSIVTHFRTDGTVLTTKTNVDGKAFKETERYRVVGSTLIIYKPEYVENTKFIIKGNQLTIDYGNGSVVMKRVS